MVVGLNIHLAQFSSHCSDIDLQEFRARRELGAHLGHSFYFRDEKACLEAAAPHGHNPGSRLLLPFPLCHVVLPLLGSKSKVLTSHLTPSPVPAQAHVTSCGILHVLD